LIGYNCIAIACKASLQLFGCLFLGFLTEHACFIVQLLGISCVCAPNKVHDEDCTVPVAESRLFLDGLCFAILLLQKRVFASHYFCHVINETKASAVLASR
jgi:piezo-type mechanosensitive ion channel component 1/2